MSSRFGASLSGAAGRAPARRRFGAGKGAMTEKEVHAYLLARDALRRIQRVSPLLVPRQTRGAWGVPQPSRDSPGGPPLDRAG